MKRLSFSLKVFITLFVLCIAGIVISTIAIDKEIDSYIEKMDTEVNITVINNTDDDVTIEQEDGNIIIKVNPEKEKSSQVTKSDENGKEEYGIVTSVVGLNVREQPTIDSKKIGTLEYGAKVKILEESGDWYRTESGFIFKEYVIKI